MTNFVMQYPPCPSQLGRGAFPTRPVELIPSGPLPIVGLPSVGGSFLQLASFSQGTAILCHLDKASSTLG